MVIGSFVGKLIVDKLPEKVFVWIIELTLDVPLEGMTLDPEAM